MNNAEDPLILAIDTSTRGGSAAVFKGRQRSSSCSGPPQESFSFSLLHLIQTALDESNSSINDVEVFAAAVGPGSFTGLRVGLATIKGLASTLSRPTCGVPTLHAVASSVGSATSTVALIPAGRGEVFAQLFYVAEGGTLAPHNDPVYVGADELLKSVGHLPGLTWAGEGARNIADAIKMKALQMGYGFVDSGNGSSMSGQSSNFPWRLAVEDPCLAVSVAALAWQNRALANLVGAENLRAIYVRPSDAELDFK